LAEFSVCGGVVAAKNVHLCTIDVQNRAVAQPMSLAKSTNPQAGPSLMAHKYGVQEKWTCEEIRVIKNGRIAAPVLTNCY
jgi:hypothetical protein